MQLVITVTSMITEPPYTAMPPAASVKDNPLQPVMALLSNLTEPLCTYMPPTAYTKETDPLQLQSSMVLSDIATELLPPTYMPPAAR